jgi:signal peptidase I
VAARTLARPRHRPEERMSPIVLLAIVVAFAIARLIITLRPALVPAEATRTTAREYLDAFIVAGAVALLIVTFLGRPYFIPSASMEPTLQIHDVLLVDKLEYRFRKPADGDIVVFPPPLASPDDFIKRVIGRPGDSISVEGGVVRRNGVALAEPYIAEKPNYTLEIKNYGVVVDGTPLDPNLANIPPKSAWTAPDKIPPHCYLMMGDNRNDSEDSHVWGFAQDSGTFYAGERKGEAAGFTGRAVLLIWPFNRIRILHR